MNKSIDTETAYYTQNYLVMMCAQYRDYAAELERDYHKMRSENWQHKCKQLKRANRDMHGEIRRLRNTVNYYRERFTELRGENRQLRAKLERYAQLEEILDSMGGDR